MRLLPLIAVAIATTAPAAPWQNDRGPGIVGQRQGDTVRYAATDFNAVAFGLASDVEVRVGPTWSVSASGPADAFANVRVTRENGTLEIGHRYRNHDNDSDQERRLHFVVTTPRLASVALGGSGQMVVDQVRGASFDAAVGGSGNLRLGSVEVDRAEVSIGGSGGVTARGSARDLKVNIGGSGSLDAPDLHARSAEVASAGSGRVRATVDGSAEVSSVGSGSIDLGAGARCSVTRMGSARVRCGG